MNAPGGFSIVEAVIATLLLTVGVLALAGTSGAVNRLGTEGAEQTGVAALAQRRVETLQATRCSQLAGGSATSGRYTETWTVHPRGTGVYDVAVTVRFVSRGRARAASFYTVIRCL